jgi:hypothetical protein
MKLPAVAITVAFAPSYRTLKARATPDFLNAVRPRRAVISAGQENPATI